MHVASACCKKSNINEMKRILQVRIKVVALKANNGMIKLNEIETSKVYVSQMK